MIDRPSEEEALRRRRPNYGTQLDERRARLEIAFRRLPPRTGGAQIDGRTVDEYLHTICNTLSTFSRRPATPDTPFRKTNRATTRKELEGLALLLDAQADALAGYVKKLHEPAIVALADRGLRRDAFADSAASMRAMARAARDADVSRVPETATRGKEPARMRALGAALFVYNGFKARTGKAPTITTSTKAGSKARGPFIDLMRAVFEILQIDSSVESVARETIKVKRACAERPKTPFAPARKL